MRKKIYRLQDSLKRKDFWIYVECKQTFDTIERNVILLLMLVPNSHHHKCNDCIPFNLFGSLLQLHLLKKKSLLWQSKDLSIPFTLDIIIEEVAI